MARSVSYAFALGLVGAVNPCAFPLLPVWLLVSAADAHALPLARRLVYSLGTAGAVTAGTLAVFAAAATAVGAGMAVLTHWAPQLLVVVATALVALGAWVLLGRNLKTPVMGSRLGAGRSRVAALLGIGATFALASLGCTLPIFLVAIGPLFASGRPAAGTACGVAYGLGTGLVITAVTLAGAAARPLRLARLRRLAPAARRLAGLVLMAIGAYLAVTWWADEIEPFHPPSVVRGVDGVQANLAAWMASAPQTVGAALATLVALTLIGGAVGAHRRERTHR